MRSDDKTSFADIPNNTNSCWWKDSCLRWNVVHCTGLYWCVFYLGYDQSLLAGLQAMNQWNSFFNNPSGNVLGLIGSSLFFPAIITPFIASFVSDRWGRKTCIAVGSLLLIIGAFINAFANSLGMFIAGRTLVGAAGPFGKITAVAMLHEIAHPRLRPILATCYWSNYYFGSISAAWFCFGSLHWGDTSWAWRAPCLFQAVAPAIALAYLLIIPESPRYLVRRGEKEKAMRILARHHANGDMEDDLIKWEYREICQALHMEAESKKTTYLDFLKTPGNRRRFLVLNTLASGTIWIGNSVLLYYLAPVLKLVGITNYTTVSGINGGFAVWNLILAYTGSLQAERIGRRRLFLVSTTGILISFIAITGLAVGFASTQIRAVGLAFIPFLFVFLGFYDIGWTPLPFSYAAEILPYNLRLKGLGYMLAAQNVCQAVNRYVNPVALESIGWKYYLIHIVLQIMYLILIWFFFPETKRMSIEEVGVVFDIGRLGDASKVRAVFELDDIKTEGKSPEDIKAVGRVNA